MSIYQTAGLHDSLVWMYAPIVRSLQTGFEAAGVAVSVGIFGTGGIQPPPARRDSQRLLSICNSMHSGDRFVWVGALPPLKWLPLEACNARGVNTALYVTEPMLGCPRIGTREVWTYSHANVLCARHGNATPLVRYVPPGYLSPSAELPLESISAVDSAASPSKSTSGLAPLSFLGYVGYADRAPCWRKIVSAIATAGGSCQAYNSISSAAALEAWWARTSSHVHLSLHKKLTARLGNKSANAAARRPRCADSSQPFEAVRASLLLSRGATMLSARSHPADERQYREVVTFASVADYPGVLRRVPTAAHRAAIARRFAERFDPRLILERAGVLAGGGH